MLCKQLLAELLLAELVQVRNDIYILCLCLQPVYTPNNL